MDFRFARVGVNAVLVGGGQRFETAFRNGRFTFGNFVGRIGEVFPGTDPEFIEGAAERAGLVERDHRIVGRRADRLQQIPKRPMGRVEAKQQGVREEAAERAPRAKGGEYPELVGDLRLLQIAI